VITQAAELMGRAILGVTCALAIGCGSRDAQVNAGEGPNSVTAATGSLQACIGTKWGAERMGSSADGHACQSLPGAKLYDQAGALYQSGDHVGAAHVAAQATQAGNPRAQLRLAMMYDNGDGVPRSAKAAFDWYARAAAQGEPASQDQLGQFYEGGDGAPENWDLAYKLYYTSAMQGWKLGQFSLGRAYEFGIGIAQNRALAIEWFRKAAAQGDGRAEYFANWLVEPTNYIGFRSNIEHDLVIGGKLRFGAELYGGDPAGVTFHNSAQRVLWLQGQRQALDKTEAEVFRAIRLREHDDCVRAGRDNCIWLP
jgi:hypothetical protein